MRPLSPRPRTKAFSGNCLHRRGGACRHLFPEESGRFGEAPSMPFLRRTALARSRCFSGSQRARVSGVFPTPPFLPNARNPLSPNIFSGAGSRCPSEVAPMELRSPPGGHGSPPRQRRPSGRTHAAWPEWKVRASPCTGPASPQPPGSAPRPGVLCGHLA